MTVQRAIPILVSAFALTACDPIARLCRTSINDRLLYPESAAFGEFELMSRQEYVDQTVDALLGDMPVMPVELRTSYRQMMHDLMRTTAQRLAANGSSFYTYRMEARGRGGATMTAVQVCAATEEHCACISGEPNVERPGGKAGRPQ